MNRNWIYRISLGICMLLAQACSEDDYPVPPASTVPKFSFEIDNNEFAPANVTFTNESVVPERAGNVSYSWSFGDGSSSLEEKPVHKYTKPGAYKVNLVVVTDASLEINEFSQTVVIKDPNATGTQVFFTNGSAVFTALINDQDPVATSIGINTLGDSYGMAIDTVNDKLYIADFDGEKILTANLDGSNLQDFRTNIGQPDAVAIDYDAEMIYWDTADGIRRADMNDTDVSQFEEFVTGQANDPEGISIDPVTHTVFWNNYNGGIWSKKTDGSGEAMIIPPNETRGGGSMLVIDDRIYYDEYIVSADIIYIKSAELDGSSITTIITDVSRVVYGMAYDKEAEKIYWVDRDEDTIMRANLDGSDAEPWYTGTSARGLVIGEKK